MFYRYLPPTEAGETYTSYGVLSLFATYGGRRDVILVRCSIAICHLRRQERRYTKYGVLSLYATYGGRRDVYYIRCSIAICHLRRQERRLLNLMFYRYMPPPRLRETYTFIKGSIVICHLRRQGETFYSDTVRCSIAICHLRRQGERLTPFGLYRHQIAYSGLHPCNGVFDSRGYPPPPAEPAALNAFHPQNLSVPFLIF